jgi:hypothetical protein
LLEGPLKNEIEMSKNWKRNKGEGGDSRDRHRGGSSGGGGGGGFGGGYGGNDISSCRGYPIIVGTCDTAREKETSKELVNLFTQTLEAMGYDDDEAEAGEGAGESSTASLSILDLIAQELAEVRSKRHRGSQRVMSVQSGIKGIVVIKVVRRNICPVALVKATFDRIRKERLALTRYVVRLIPLQMVFFPSAEELTMNLTALLASIPEQVGDKISSAEEPREEDSSKLLSITSSSQPLDELEQGKAFAEAIAAKLKKKRNANRPSSQSARLVYSISYKARNHNVLTRHEVVKAVTTTMPSYATFNLRSEKVLFLMDFLDFVCDARYQLCLRRACFSLGVGCRRSVEKYMRSFIH